MATQDLGDQVYKDPPHGHRGNPIPSSVATNEKDPRWESSRIHCARGSVRPVSVEVFTPGPPVWRVSNWGYGGRYCDVTEGRWFPGTGVCSCVNKQTVRNI